MSFSLAINSKINDGLKHEKIIIVGIVRNVEKTIAKDLERFEEAFAMFGEIQCFLVESGSSDNSKKVLEDYSKRRSGFSYLLIELAEGLSRTENMAIARNGYLDYLRTNQKFREFKYVVIADFNNLNNKINYESVESCWTNNEWDVVSANQSGRYYDVWALRHPLWSPNDCWEELEFRRRYIKFPEIALAYSIRSRMIKIPKNSKWIEVDSAFGGLAIYKSELFSLDAKYCGLTSDGTKTCEHVEFHKSLRESGKRFFVNPRLINARITDHSRRMSLAFSVLRILNYPIKFLQGKPR